MTPAMPWGHPHCRGSWRVGTRSSVPIFDTRQSAGQVVWGAAVRERTRPLATVRTKPKPGWRSQGPQPCQEQPSARRWQTWPQAMERTGLHKRRADHSLQMGVCNMCRPALNMTLSQLNRLHIIPKNGEHRKGSVIELHLPFSQQTCRDRTGYSDIFLLYHTRSGQTGQRSYRQRGREVALGALDVYPGQTAQRLSMPQPKLFLSTLAILVSLPCKALKRDQLKSQSYLLILIAPKQSAHPRTACIWVG